MIYSDELLAVAKRIFWFGTSEEALEFPKRFLTYAMTYAWDEDIEILRKYSPTMISRPDWMTPHPGFSTEAPGPNGMNVTSALPSRRFRGERFPASIPQPSRISFPPSIENISEVYRLFSSFESSVPCTSVFTFRVPRQWKPGLFSGSSRLRFASGSRSLTASTFVPCGSCASRGLSCFPQLLVAVGFFAFLLRERVL